MRLTPAEELMLLRISHGEYGFRDIARAIRYTVGVVQKLSKKMISEGYLYQVKPKTALLLTDQGKEYIRRHIGYDHSQ